MGVKKALEALGWKLAIGVIGFFWRKKSEDILKGIHGARG
jgi:hypothetical protein